MAGLASQESGTSARYVRSTAVSAERLERQVIRNQAVRDQSIAVGRIDSLSPSLPLFGVIVHLDRRCSPLPDRQLCTNHLAPTAAV